MNSVRRLELEGALPHPQAGSVETSADLLKRYEADDERAKQTDQHD